MKKTLPLLGLIILSTVSFSQAETSDCLPPKDLLKSGISTESVTVEWVEQGTAVAWELLYGEAGFSPEEAGTLINTTSLFYELSGLVSGTSYEFYVRSVCSVESTSEWTGPLSVFIPFAGDNCETAIDLSVLNSPYSGTITGAISDFDFCSLSGRRDLVFYYDVAPDAALEIWSDSYSFSGVGAMRWGDTCPGDHEIACGVDSDQGRFFWKNDTETSQRVWFVIATTSTSPWYSDFFLRWNYYNPGSCLMAANLSLVEISTNSARLSWSGQYGSGPWEVVYGLQGFSLPTEGAQLTVTSPEVELTDVAHSKRYDVYVRSLCGEGKKSSWSKKSIKTNCGVWDLPFEYDFSEYDCWNSTRVGSSGYTTTVDEQLRMIANRASLFVSTPELGADLNGTLLSFNGRLLNDAALSGSLEVGVMSNPSDVTTFISQAVYDASVLSRDMVPFRVMLDGVPETHRFISFKLMADASVGQVSFYLDDVLAEVAPACISPQLLRRVSATSESLVAEWDEVGEAQQWELVYGLSGFDINSEGTSVEVTTTTHEVSGLTRGMPYDFYVRSICGEGQNSDWSGPVVLRVPVMGDNCSNAIDLSEMTAPYFGSLENAENDFFHCGMGNDNDLVLYHDVEPGAGLQLYHLYDNYSSRISLRWGGSCPGDNEIACQTDILDNPIVWINETDEIQRVWLVEGAYYGSGKFVLNWQFLALGYCYLPTSLMATEPTLESVKLTWEDMAGADEWELVYGPQGFNAETGGSRITVQAPEVVLDGLQPSTSYDYYVRAVCSEESDLWASSTFDTQCGAVSLPYVAKFDSNNEVRCWKYFHQGWNNFSIYNGAISYNVAAKSVAVHVLPLFDDIPAETYVRLQTSRYASGSGVLQIGTLSNPNDTTTFVAANSYPISSSNNWPQDFTAILNQKPEGHSYIGIRMINPNNESMQLRVNGLEVRLAGDCEVPGNFRLDELNPRSALFSWSELGAAEEWELRIISNSSNAGTKEEVFTVANTTFEVEGLNPGVSYEAYIRPTCADDKVWTGPLLFYTPNSCSVPTGIIAERISDSSVLVSWNKEDGVDAWELHYQNFTTWEVQLVQVNGDAQFLLEQLDPETFYEIGVQAICGGEDGQSWTSSRIQVSGICSGTRDLPYAQDFEGLPNGSLPVCWKSHQSGNASNGLSVQSDSRLGKHLYFDVRNHNSFVTALLPEVDQSITDVRISFKTFKPTWNGTLANLQIGVQGEHDFLEAEAIEVKSSSHFGWTQQVIYLNDLDLTSGRLALRLKTSGDFYYMNLYLTDVVVETIPDRIEPHGLRVDDLNQTSGEISWLQFETADRVELIWGQPGFDPATEVGKEVLAADALNFQLTGLLPNTGYEAYVRNVANVGGASSWAGPLQFHTPCEPMEIHLLNVSENEVLSSQNNQDIHFSYKYKCYGQVVEVALIRLDGDDWPYSMGTFIPVSEEGVYEFALPSTLWGGAYAVEVSYTDYNSNGLRGTLLARSETFVIENQYPQIEVRRPVENSVVVVENENGSFMYLAWNTFALNSVKVEYTLDGGANWQVLNKSRQVYEGFSTSGYSSQRIDVPFAWVGEKVQFRVSSVFLPDVFDISHEVQVVDKNPFSIVGGFFEVPLGTDLEIAYEATINSEVHYEVIDGFLGEVCQIGKVLVDAGSGLLSISTDKFVVGRYYFVRLTRVGLEKNFYVDFEITNPTHLSWQTEASSNVKLYPVPATDLLYINAPGLDANTLVVLYDLSGRRIMEALLGEGPLNVGHLHRGVYLVVVEGQTYKVVKQ